MFDVFKLKREFEPKVMDGLGSISTGKRGASCWKQIIEEQQEPRTKEKKLFIYFSIKFKKKKKRVTNNEKSDLFSRSLYFLSWQHICHRDLESAHWTLLFAFAVSVGSRRRCRSMFAHWAALCCRTTHRPMSRSNGHIKQLSGVSCMCVLRKWSRRTRGVEHQCTCSKLDPLQNNKHVLLFWRGTTYY